MVHQLIKKKLVELIFERHQKYWMENSCIVSRGLVVLSLLVICCCCFCHDLKTKHDKHRFCSKDSNEDDGICIDDEEHKYSQEANEKKDGLSIELKLKELELNNSSAKLEDLGFQPIEPEWKSVALPVVEAVKVSTLLDYVLLV